MLVEWSKAHLILLLLFSLVASQDYEYESTATEESISDLDSADIKIIVGVAAGFGIIIVSWIIFKLIERYQEQKTKDEGLRRKEIRRSRREEHMRKRSEIGKSQFQVLQRAASGHQTLFDPTTGATSVMLLSLANLGQSVAGTNVVSPRSVLNVSPLIPQRVSVAQAQPQSLTGVLGTLANTQTVGLPGMTGVQTNPQIVPGMPLAQTNPQIVPGMPGVQTNPQIVPGMPGVQTGPQIVPGMPVAQGSLQTVQSSHGAQVNPQTLQNMHGVPLSPLNVAQAQANTSDPKGGWYANYP